MLDSGQGVEALRAGILGDADDAEVHGHAGDGAGAVGRAVEPAAAVQNVVATLTVEEVVVAVAVERVVAVAAAQEVVAVACREITLSPVLPRSEIVEGRTGGILDAVEDVEAGGAARRSGLAG